MKMIVEEVDQKYQVSLREIEWEAEYIYRRDASLYKSILHKNVNRNIVRPVTGPHGLLQFMAIWGEVDTTRYAIKNTIGLTL